MDNLSKKSGRKPDPRVIRTRKLLRDSLMALIPEKGFDAITIQDITDRATLNHATFYLHYRDKDDLLTQIIESVLQEVAAIPAKIHLSSDSNTIRQVFVQLFEHVARHEPFYRIMLLEPSVARYTRKIQAYIEQIGMHWLSMGQRPQELQMPPDLFISFIGAAYLGFIKWWVVNNMPYPPDYMAEQFMRLAVSGILSDFGINPSPTRKAALPRRPTKSSVEFDATLPGFDQLPK